MKEITDILYEEELRLDRQKDYISKSKHNEYIMCSTVRDALSDEHFALVQKWVAMIDENHENEKKDMYKRGFKAGLQFMQEFYTSKR